MHGRDDTNVDWMDVGDIELVCKKELLELATWEANSQRINTYE